MRLRVVTWNIHKGIGGVDRCSGDVVKAVATIRGHVHRPSRKGGRWRRIEHPIAIATAIAFSTRAPIAPCQLRGEDSVLRHAVAITIVM